MPDSLEAKDAEKVKKSLQNPEKNAIVKSDTVSKSVPPTKVISVQNKDLTKNEALSSSVINKQIQKAPIDSLIKLNAELDSFSKRISEIESFEKQSPQPLNISELIKEKKVAKIRITENNIIKSQTNNSTKLKNSNGFLKDILTDEDGTISFSRFQY